MKLNKDHYLSLFYIGLGVLILFFTSRITSLFSVDTIYTGAKFLQSLCCMGIILCCIVIFLTSDKRYPYTFLS